MFLSFDLLTALTITSILGILVFYVIVVYKKGWLKRNSKESETYFLCPNQKCRKVFKEPIWLTDLSKTPPESYQACPNCGISLHITPSFSANRSPQLQKPLEGTHHIQRETVPERAGIIKEYSKPTYQTIISQSPEKSADLHEPKSLTQHYEIRRETPSKTSETPKKHEEKKLAESPRACSHFFGYVKTLPKNTSIPDECLWCPMIVKCLTGTERVDA